MPTIRSVSYLRDNIEEIFKICQQRNEPIFITHKDKEAFVILSNDFYESLIEQNRAREELYQLLDEAEMDRRPRVKFETAIEMIDKAIANAST